MYNFLQNINLSLNLANKESSDFKFHISSFPDGQHNIKIDSFITNPLNDYTVTIKTRFNNFIDLEILCCAVYALRDLGFENIELYCPYILGARSDRKFQDGSTRYLKDIIAPLINGLNFKKVYSIDPHSDVMENVINNFHKTDNLELVKFALEFIYGPTFYHKKDSFTLISPDAGALKKIYNVAEKIQVTDIETASKHRDIISGKILATIVSRENFEGKDAIIIDDICDGGRTFIELAKVLRNKNVGNIYLIITHGIFSAGFTELSEYIDEIFCTNSISDLNGTFEIPNQKIKRDDGIKVTDIKNLVSQLNVF